MRQPPHQVTDLSTNTVCARCGAAFVCGFTAGLPECWCMQAGDGPHLPVPAPEDAVSCLCPACLRLARAQHGDGFAAS